MPLIPAIAAFEVVAELGFACINPAFCCCSLAYFLELPLDDLKGPADPYILFLYLALSPPVSAVMSCLD